MSILSSIQQKIKESYDKEKKRVAEVKTQPKQFIPKVVSTASYKAQAPKESKRINLSTSAQREKLAQSVEKGFDKARTLRDRANTTIREKTKVDMETNVSDVVQQNVVGTTPEKRQAIKYAQQEFRNAPSYYAQGYATGIIRNPETAIVSTGLGFGVGALGGMGAGLGTAGAKLVTGAGIVGGTVYAGKTGYDLSKTGSFKGFISGAGAKTSTEIHPAGFGAIQGFKIGYPAGLRVQGLAKTTAYKQKLVRAERFGDIKVLKGEERLVVRPRGQKPSVSKDISRFEKSYFPKEQRGKISYHASAKEFTKGAKSKPFNIETGTSEVGGIYGANKPSTNFLRLKAKSSYGSSLKVQGTEPTLYIQKTSGFKKFPTKPTYPAMNKFLGLKSKGLGKGFKEVGKSKADIGSRYVVGKKPEIEDIGSAGTYISGATKSYTQIKSAKYYQNLEKIGKGTQTRYVSRVKPFEWTKPSTYIDKIAGKTAGQFKIKETWSGTRVPIKYTEPMTSALTTRLGTSFIPKITVNPTSQGGGSSMGSGDSLSGTYTAYNPSSSTGSLSLSQIWNSLFKSKEKPSYVDSEYSVGKPLPSEPYPSSPSPPPSSPSIIISGGSSGGSHSHSGSGSSGGFTPSPSPSPPSPSPSPSPSRIPSGSGSGGSSFGSSSYWSSLGGMSGFGGTSGGFKYKTPKRKYRYTPSGYSLLTENFGKPSKYGTISGLGTRPIPLSFKSKKKKSKTNMRWNKW